MSYNTSRRPCQARRKQLQIGAHINFLKKKKLFFFYFYFFFFFLGGGGGGGGGAYLLGGGTAPRAPPIPTALLVHNSPVR